MSVLPRTAKDHDLTVWTMDQLIKSGEYPDEYSVLRSALRALFQVNPQVKIRMIASAYRQGELSLGKAAELLGVSQEEAKEMLRESNTQLHLGPMTLEELQSDAANA